MNQVVQRQNTVGANWINALLGLWVIISPFVLGFTRNQAAMWNNVATGGAVLLLALGRGGTSGVAVRNLLLGGWLIASPFVLGFLQQVIFWNNIILGIVIVICAILLSTGVRALPARLRPSSDEFLIWGLP